MNFRKEYNGKTKRNSIEIIFKFKNIKNEKNKDLCWIGTI